MKNASSWFHATDDYAPYGVSENSSRGDVKDGTVPGGGRSVSYQSETAKILERITDGFISVDIRGNITYLNRAAEKMLGNSCELLLGHNIEAVPTVSDHFKVHYKKALREQVAVTFESHYIPQDLWCDITLYPSDTGMSIFFRNISERRQVDENIRRLALVATRTNNFVILLSPAGRISWANDAFYESSGYSPEDIVNKTPAEAFHGPTTNPEIAAFIRTQLMLGEGFQTEIICYKKNGEAFWASINCQPIYSEGKLQKFFSISTDITARKQSEEELKKLSLIVKYASNPIILLNEEKIITWVNEAFLKFTGFDGNEVIGRSPEDLLKGAESDPARAARFHASLEKKITFHDEIVCYHKEGQKLRAELTSQSLFDDHGQFTHYFLILKDITEKSRLQEELQIQEKEKQRQITIAATRAQELERSRVGKELHDNVNQVLTTVKLYTELCRDGAENKQHLMNRSVTLLQDCINDIRNLSKRLTGPVASDISFTESIRDLVATVLETQKVKIRLYTINLEHYNPSEDLHIAVYRILQEHLTNILKHASAENVVIRIQRSTKCITIKVVDDGIGFDTKVPRSGIGLTNMKTRALNLKGSLRITTAPGKGCELSVRLPLHA
jgi:PAS domain S-box-containing protein